MFPAVLRCSLIACAAGFPLALSAQGPTLLPPESIPPGTVSPGPPPFAPSLPPSAPERPAPPPFSPMPAANPLDRLRPQGNDFSKPSLEAYYSAFEQAHGPTYRDVPLEVKAELYEWALERYHWTPWDQVLPRVILSDDPAAPIGWHPGADIATWNGALLQALAYKYAVTKSPDTLARIERLVRGMHLFFEVTGQPGLPARCVIDRSIDDFNRPYTTADGRQLFFKSDAAKGTVNQVAAGLTLTLILAGPDLPPATQQLIRADLQDLADHLVTHDYKLTEADGERTEFGNLTPRFGSTGVPFNAQVAYQIVSGSAHFPGPDPAKTQRVQEAFDELRLEHHVYYEDPRRHFILPQRIGASPLVKGMNDRNHVCNAAYVGLMIERHAAQVHGRQPGAEFTFQLGRTMVWTLREIERQRNALCNFQFVGLLSDPQVSPAMIRPEEVPEARAQAGRLHADAVEQLRRFVINRFGTQGEKVETREPQWVDARQRHDSYQWKADPFAVWKQTGGTTSTHTASIDFLHAYWLARYWSLDRIGAATPQSP